MKLYRCILSLLLLSAYALLLLHDFIPHSHPDHQTDVQTAATVQHSHGHHHHTHEHHEEKGMDDERPEPSGKDPFGNHLIHTHSHSDYVAHQHDLVYRAATKDKFIPQSNAAQLLVEDSRKPPDQLDVSNARQFRFLPIPSCPHLSAGHGLRAPPAVG